MGHPHQRRAYQRCIQLKNICIALGCDLPKKKKIIIIIMMEMKKEKMKMTMMTGFSLSLSRATVNAQLKRQTRR